MILFETREQYGLQTSHKIVCRGGFRWRYKRLAKIFAILGPAFIAAVAYIDPGNFATNITAGSQYGYLLLWVIAFSNLMAVLIQSLSAKLGIATGKNLPEVAREHFSKNIYLFMDTGRIGHHCH